MLSPLSFQTLELNDKGYSIKIDDDKICFTKDGESSNIYFNCLYNKDEVNALITTGGNDPTYLRDVALSGINEILKTLITFNGLIYVDSKLNKVTKNIQNSSNALLELWRWTSSNMDEINKAVNDVIGVINGINSCHCMDEGGLHDQVVKVEGLINKLDGYVTTVLLTEINRLWKSFSNFSTRVWSTTPEQILDPLKKVEEVYTEGKIPLTNELAKIWAPPNDESQGDEKTYDIIDPSELIKDLTIPVVNDPYKRTFDENKPVYGKMNMPYDLEVNGLINGIDINNIQPIENNFTKLEGYEYYYIENDDVYTDDYTYNSVECKKMAIKNIPESTINKLKNIDERTDIFRIILRKNEIIDESGAFIKEFFIYVENKRLYCPVITIHSPQPLSHIVDKVETPWTDNPFIALDKASSLELFKCYLQGDISIMYLLPQNTIESNIPEIKCDIITAKNALKLHESNVAYVYKPSFINESGDNYSMTFNIPDNHPLPTGMEFCFKEFCFNNTWLLTWDGDKWVGNNIQAKSKAEEAIDVIEHWDQQGHTVISIEKNDFNDYIIQNWFKIDISNEKEVFKQIINDKRTTITFDGLYDNNETFEVSRGGLNSLKSMLGFGDFTNRFDKYLEGGYYHAQFNIAVNVEIKRDSLKKQIIENYINHIKELHMFINVGGLTNKFIFDIYITNDPLEEYTSGPQCYYIKVKTLKNTIQHFGAKFEGTNISSGNKDITLHLDRKMLRPIEEVNWDPTTNPFKYIIDQQFYSVSPNPNAATTLYTDYNITSSKIITADNITTMRSDLNLVANTQDVIVYDVDKITKRVDNLDIEMTDVKNRVTHLESKVNSVNIKTNIALVLSVASSVLSIGNTLELAGNYISIGMGKLRNFINNGYTRLPEAASEASEVEMAAVDYSENLTPVPFENSLQTYSIDETNSDGYAKLKTWIHSSHVKPKFSSLYASTNEESANNPQCMVVSYSTVHDVCMYYRDSLKPLFSVVCSKLDIMNNDLSSINAELNNYPTVEQVNETLTNYRLKNNLEYIHKKTQIGDLNIENKEWHNGITAYVPFQEQTVLEGYFTDLPDYTFSFMFNTQRVRYNIDGGTLHSMEITCGNNKTTTIDWNITTGAIMNYDKEHCITLTKARGEIEIEINDTLVLKSEIDTLKDEIKLQQPVINAYTKEESDEKYATVDEVNEALGNYVLKNEVDNKLNNYATIQYVKDAYPSYAHLNANFKNNNQLTNILKNYVLKSDLTNTLNDYYTTAQVDEKFVDEDEMAYELNNYVSKSDYDVLAEKVIALENENAELKAQMKIFNDFMNSFEQNTETRLLTENDLILNYYDDYATMSFKGKIDSGSLSIGLGIEGDVDWHVTLAFENGRFISVDDNDINIVECNDETGYYIKLSTNNKIVTIYLESTTINIRV
ncbi:hypothetical protein M9Y10_001220 [Tritrichomonas musculus]|uniref:Tail fiber protein n=1 Tax=Tritrichomonas musculus TaxID=1915356 RepID=A0ABR2L6H5_9EUKA